MKANGWVWPSKLGQRQIHIVFCGIRRVPELLAGGLGWIAGGEVGRVIRRDESGLTCKAATGTPVAGSPRYVAEK